MAEGRLKIGRWILTYAEIKELAAAIRKPHPAWTPDELWRAYKTLDRSRVRGSGRRILTDLVSLVRFATEAETVLRPFNDSVKERFLNWLAEQERDGRAFTEKQRLVHPGPCRPCQGLVVHD